MYKISFYTPVNQIQWIWLNLHLINKCLVRSLESSQSNLKRYDSAGLNLHPWVRTRVFAQLRFPYSQIKIRNNVCQLSFEVLRVDHQHQNIPVFVPSKCDDQRQTQYQNLTTYIYCCVGLVPCYIAIYSPHNNPNYLKVGTTVSFSGFILEVLVK